MERLTRQLVIKSVVDGVNSLGRSREERDRNKTDNINVGS